LLGKFHELGTVHKFILLKKTYELSKPVFHMQVVPDLKAPVVLFTYYNPILNCGMEAFSKAVKAAGASGLLLFPDNLLQVYRVPNTIQYEFSRFT
jgi:tryptophan synthase alpha subunit